MQADLVSHARFKAVCGAGYRVIPLGAALLLALLIPAPVGAAPVLDTDCENASDPTQARHRLRELLDEGRYDEAETEARALLATAEATEGPDSLAAARILEFLVPALARGGHEADPETLQLAKRALAIRQERQSGHPDVAEAEANVAGVLLMLGRYDEARTHYERALQIQEAQAEPDSLAVAKTVNNLANSVRRMGDFEAAIPLYERARRIRETDPCSNRRDLAWTLNGFGTVLMKVGRYDEALSAHTQALSIREEELGENHITVAGSLNNLANLLVKRGEYAEAIGRYERSLRIKISVHGPKHPDVARTQNNLAELFYWTGDYMRARELQEKALATRQATLPEIHPDIAISMSRLGDILVEIGDAERAKALYRGALRIRMEALGRSHTDTAESQDRYARMLALESAHEEAEALYEKALAAQIANYGVVHPLVATIQLHLADLFSETGNLTRAESLYRQVVATRETTIGNHHPAVADALVGLARLQTIRGETADALQAALRAEEIGRQHLRLTITALAERQALRYASTRASGLDLALSIAVGGVGPDAVAEIWHSLVASRALVLDEMAERGRAWSEVADGESARLRDEFTIASRRLANLIVGGTDPDSPEHNWKQYKELLASKESLERALASRNVRFRSRQARTDIDLHQVQAHLPAGAGLISFFRFYRHRMKPATATERTGDSPFYVAFVLGAGRPPALVQLGPGERIDGLVSSWKEALLQPLVTPQSGFRELPPQYRRAATQLRQALWDPLTEHVTGRTLLFIVPDGLINLVSFTALPSGEDYLLQRGPLLHYLSAERDLVTLQERAASSSSGLLALGGPEFDDTGSFASLQQEETAPARLGGSMPVAGPLRLASRSACAEFRSLRFDYLPYTVEEARMITRMWSREPLKEAESGDSSLDLDHEAVLLTGPEASEAAVKSNAPGRHVLHFATHGFFLGEECSAPVHTSRGIGRLGPGNQSGGSAVFAENPLLISGLALAGFNHRSAAGVEEEDGVLTAAEIASLDLTDVELAVLSACDTGLGRIESGEGVLGLRRAFQTAGTRTVIASLWAIEDQSALDWMKAFYRNRFQQEMSVATAVRRASMELADYQRNEDNISHPFYWAAFVATGDWR